MKSQTGATYIACSHNGDGAVPRPFKEPEPPPPSQWAAAVSSLTTALAAISKLGHADATAVAITALARTNESVPAIMKDPAIRSAVAVGGALAEHTGSRGSPLPSEVGNAILGLLRQLSEIKTEMSELREAPPPVASASSPSEPSTPEPPFAGPPPAPLTVAQLIARLEMLAPRKTAARRRADSANVRTIGTQMTQTRKKLRALLAEHYDPDDPHHRAAAHLLGIAAVKSEKYGSSAT